MRVTLDMIDPELRPAGRLLRALDPGRSVWRLKMLGRLASALAPPVRGWDGRYSVCSLPRDDGSRMRVCVFHPPMDGRTVPGVLWLHGGGYALGAPEQAGRMARSLIDASACVVVAPAYRLSVHAPFPAALDDAYAALLWMRDNADELGIRPDRLMVGGESAGGGLAAAVALRARDRCDVSIAFQMPLYPMLDDRMDTPSAIGNDAPVWNTRSSANAWRLYLRDLDPRVETPALAAPARARDLSRLPPAATFVGDLDPFRDETLAYFQRLSVAGVSAEIEILPGCYHGFDVVSPRSQPARRAMSFLLGAYVRAADGACG